MRAFAELLDVLDTTRSAAAKLAAMARFLVLAAPADAAWATYILCRRDLTAFVTPMQLRSWLGEAAALPRWLIDETLTDIADLSESIALLTASTTGPETPGAHADANLSTWLEDRLPMLRALTESGRRARITAWWRMLPYRECVLLNRLLIGELRADVSEAQVVRAVSEATSRSGTAIADLLAGPWQPSEAFWCRLQSQESDRAGGERS